MTTETPTKAIELPKGWVMAADGRPIHLDNVDPLKKSSNKLIKKLIKSAQNMRTAMELFKGKADSEIDLHLVAMFEEYNRTLGGKKGGLSLVSIDGLMKIQRSIGGNLKFDERILVAKDLIFDVIKSQSGSKLLKTLAYDAFDVNKDGDYNPAKLSALTKHKFENADWMKACDLIHQSRYYEGKKPYLRFFVRETVNDKWEAIALDMAKI